MTVSTTPYYRWADRNDSQQPPFDRCSPSLVQLLDYYRRRWGAVSLGCHNERPVRAATMSTHAWGAACDPKFPGRAVTEEAMGFTIANSAELGVNTIHDYQRQMMWKPNIGWVSASIGSLGGQWIHVETTPAAFSDGRPVEDRLSGTPDEIPPGDDFMSPEDKAYLDAQFKHLKDHANAIDAQHNRVYFDAKFTEGVAPTVEVGVKLDALIVQAQALADAITNAGDPALAAIEAAVEKVLEATTFVVGTPSV